MSLGERQGGPAHRAGSLRDKRLQDAVCYASGACMREGDLQPLLLTQPGPMGRATRAAWRGRTFRTGESLSDSFLSLTRPTSRCAPRRATRALADFHFSFFCFFRQWGK